MERVNARRPIAVLAVAVAASGCAARAGAPPGLGQLRDTPASYAHPEPDPGCRATVQERLTANSLDRVTVKVTQDQRGKVEVVEFLGPDLTPAAMMELRQAFAQCVWKPVIAADGHPEAWTTTFVRLR